MADISPSLFRLLKLPDADLRAGLLELAEGLAKTEHRQKTVRERVRRFRQKRYSNGYSNGVTGVTDCVTVTVTQDACISNIIGNINRLEKEESKIQANRPKRGTRLPPEWQPSFEDRRYASAAGLSDADIDRMAENFIDYWIAVPGAKGVKLDWPATWRMWVRRTVERSNPKTATLFSARPLTQAQKDAQIRKAKYDAIIADNPGPQGNGKGGPPLGSPDPEIISPIRGRTH